MPKGRREDMKEMKTGMETETTTVKEEAEVVVEEEMEEIINAIGEAEVEEEEETDLLDKRENAYLKKRLILGNTTQMYRTETHVKAGQEDLEATAEQVAVAEVEAKDVGDTEKITSATVKCSKMMMTITLKRNPICNQTLTDTLQKKKTNATAEEVEAVVMGVEEEDEVMVVEAEEVVEVTAGMLDAEVIIIKEIRH